MSGKNTSMELDPTKWDVQRLTEVETTILKTVGMDCPQIEELYQRYQKVLNEEAFFLTLEELSNAGYLTMTDKGLLPTVKGQLVAHVGNDIKPEKIKEAVHVVNALKELQPCNSLTISKKIFGESGTSSMINSCLYRCKVSGITDQDSSTRWFLKGAFSSEKRSKCKDCGEENEMLSQHECGAKAVKPPPRRSMDFDFFYERIRDSPMSEFLASMELFRLTSERSKVLYLIGESLASTTIFSQLYTQARPYAEIAQAAQKKIPAPCLGQVTMETTKAEITRLSGAMMLKDENVGKMLLSMIGALYEKKYDIGRIRVLIGLLYLGTF